MYKRLKRKLKFVEYIFLRTFFKLYNINIYKLINLNIIFLIYFQIEALDHRQTFMNFASSDAKDYYFIFIILYSHSMIEILIFAITSGIINIFVAQLDIFLNF